MLELPPTYTLPYRRFRNRTKDYSGPWHLVMGEVLWPCSHKYKIFQISVKYRSELPNQVMGNCPIEVTDMGQTVLIPNPHPAPQSDFGNQVKPRAVRK